MKIYTRTGDTGETALFGGGRVSKSHSRVEACGDVDELNSVLGLALAHASVQGTRRMLERIQNLLLNVGADLATPMDRSLDQRIDGAGVEEMEAAIDAMEEQLPPLRTFILPGGAEASAWLHLCRAVCRRAERSTVRLAQECPVNPHVLVFLNRLSDLLFVMARFENFSLGVADSPWTKQRG